MKNYYNELIELKARFYGYSAINLEGQDKFYLNPLEGENAPIIAVCHNLQRACDTNVFDICFFAECTNTLPVFLETELKYEFEI